MCRMGCYYSWCSTRLNSRPSPLFHLYQTIRLFADDTSLYLIIDEPYTEATQLNSDLAKIHTWAERWPVKFIPAKSEAIIISRKTQKNYHPPLEMND